MESKKALVLGLGTSGYASALYLAERGWSVRVMDTRREPSLLARLKADFHKSLKLPGRPFDSLSGCTDVNLHDLRSSHRAAVSHCHSTIEAVFPPLQL